MNTKHYRSGFTLVELMVVMIILSILSTIGMFAFQSSQKKGRDLRKKQDLSTIAKGLEMYANDRGVYPFGQAGIIMGCGATYNLACAWGSMFWGGGTSTAPAATYMVKLPKDPVTTRQYYYESVSVGGAFKGYRIYAVLENTDDIDIPTTGQKTYATNCSSVVGTTVYCNYVVSSSSVPMPTPRP